VLRELPAVPPLAVAVAVADAVGPGARMKWPNDVLVDGRKVAGILIEGRAHEGWLVLGIGVNVALGPEDLPPALRESTTSWRLEKGGARDPLEVAAAVLGRLRVWYDVLAGGVSAAVAAAWRERSVPWWGLQVAARSGDQEVRGIARGISESGALVLEAADGSRREVLAGEVHEVRPSP
jgi:BirA family biotin operon repressor/biotin-[acetyl-CoA-carboxylase] ligase